MQLSMNNLLASKVKRMRRENAKLHNKFHYTKLDNLLFDKYAIFSNSYNIVGVHEIKYFFFSYLQGTDWLKCYRYDGFVESYHEHNDALLDMMEEDSTLTSEEDDRIPDAEEIYSGNVEWGIPSCNIWYQSKFVVPELDDDDALEEISIAILELLNYKVCDAWKQLISTEWRMAFSYALYRIISSEGAIYISLNISKELNDIIEHYSLGDVMKAIDSDYRVMTEEELENTYEEYMVFPFIYHFVSQAIRYASKLKMH